VTDAHTKSLWASGFTLRFPRVKQIRYEDKDYKSTTTFDDIDTLWREQAGKLFSLKDGDLVDNESTAKTREKRQKTGGGSASGGGRAPVKIGTQFQHKHLDPQKRGSISTMFKGKDFCIHSNNSGTLDKDDLTGKLHELGATVVENPKSEAKCEAEYAKKLATEKKKSKGKGASPSKLQGGGGGGVVKEIATYAIIAEYTDLEKKTINLKTTAAMKDFNVIRPGWVQECFDAREEVFKKPNQVLSALANVQAEMEDYCDQYGDCYSENSTPAGLLALFGNYKEPMHGARADVVETEAKLFDRGRIRPGRSALLDRNLHSWVPLRVFTPFAPLEALPCV
jgi:hypothetical protein